MENGSWLVEHSVSTVVSLKWFLRFYLVVLIRHRKTVTFECHIEVDMKFARHIYGNSSICNISVLCCWRWYYLKIEEVERNLDLKDLWCANLKLNNSPSKYLRLIRIQLRKMVQISMVVVLWFFTDFISNQSQRGNTTKRCVANLNRISNLENDL